jgi:hypothetical protein
LKDREIFLPTIHINATGLPKKNGKTLVCRLWIWMSTYVLDRQAGPEGQRIHPAPGVQKRIPRQKNSIWLSINRTPAAGGVCKQKEIWVHPAADGQSVEKISINIPNRKAS